MQLTNVCCNPLGLVDAKHDINVAAISYEVMVLFEDHLWGETHTCLMCRIKLLEQLWITQPGKCDSTVVSILDEAVRTLNRMHLIMDDMKRKTEEKNDMKMTNTQLEEIPSPQ